MSTNNTLNDLGNIASIANNYQLEKIKGDLQRLSRYTQDAAFHQENQRNLRQQIFEIRDLLQKRLPTIKDEVVKYIYLLQIRSMVTANGLSPASFDEINDKQYFSDTLDLINNEIISLSEYADWARETIGTLNVLKHEIAELKKIMAINFDELTDVKIDNALLLMNGLVVAFISFVLSIIPIVVIFGNSGDDKSPIVLSIFISLLIGVIAAIFLLPKILRKKASKAKMDYYISIFEIGYFKDRDFANEIIAILKNYNGENSSKEITEKMETLYAKLNRQLSFYYESFPELKNII